jgi:hypothetical protein
MAALATARRVETLDRPAWLYRSGGAIPSLELHFRAARKVSDADVTLCQRLIDAYDLAQADAPPVSGMWSHPVFSHRQRELLDALQKRDPRILANRLSSMFRSDFVLGMAFGSLGVGQSPMSNRLMRLSVLSQLAALAESQGVVRAENPEQGSAALAFVHGADKLVADTEEVLGVPLDFPDVGAAYGIQITDRALISTDSADQIYAAARLRNAARDYLSDHARPLRIVEIGAGYGAMAYWILLMTDARYVIVDLPVVNVLQGYFLAQALGSSEVSCYGEAPSRVAVLPTHALSTIDVPFDILVNKDSMPEIPAQAVVDYLSWARTACTGIFYSYNQEAAALQEHEVPQNVVPEVVARLGGFTTIRRDTSWLRRGYVEDLYAMSASGSTEAQP